MQGLTLTANTAAEKLTLMLIVDGVDGLTQI